MKVKNLSGSTMHFPKGREAQPGQTILIPDADWVFAQYHPGVKAWITAGLVELNGTLPAVEIVTTPAPEGGVYGRLVILANQAAYTAITSPRADTMYAWPEA